VMITSKAVIVIIQLVVEIVATCVMW
jgi:hypothetical protein